MAADFQLEIYKEMALSLHCYSRKGTILPAKPLLLIGICNAIDSNLINDNRISIVDIERQYRLLQEQYKINTPFNYPFYFLANESFYHIKWKFNKIVAKNPSMSLLRNNVDFAYLDNALWDLLQIKENRDYFRKSIEDYYLK